jgi:hypothetical protein
MINPNMPNIPGMPNFPGMGAMTDTLEFVKNLWGSMGIPGLNMSSMNMPGLPGMVVPTLSVEEIRKKVSDLRAVETWLELNMNMLRGTIQALEVQAATLATLQSMGDALSATVSSTSGFGQPVQQKPAAPSRASSSSAPEQKSAAAPGAQRASEALPGMSGLDEASVASLTAPLINAATWWNMLQDQFTQAVNTAIAAEAPAMPSAASAKASPKAEHNGESKGESEAKGDSRGDSKGNAGLASPAARKRKPSK